MPSDVVTGLRGMMSALASQKTERPREGGPDQTMLLPVSPPRGYTGRHRAPEGNPDVVRS